LFYVEVFVINSYVVTLLESFQQSGKNPQSSHDK